MSNNEYTSYNEEIFNLLNRNFEMFGNYNYGKIDGLGKSFFTRSHAEYVFRLPFNLEKHLIKSSGGDVPEAGASTLLEAYKVFGFFTIGEILASKQWNEILSPKLETKKDLFYACIEIINSFGYGKYEVESYEEKNYEEKTMGGKVKRSITINLNGSIEAELYTKYQGTTKTPKCYLSRGILISISNLVFNCDIEQGSLINAELYEKNSTEKVSYKCEELKCISQSKNFERCSFRLTN